MNGKPRWIFPPGYYTGESNTWNVADVLLTEVWHPTGKAVALHEHEAPYFSLLLEGSYQERGDGFDLRYEPYTLVFHSAGTVHEDELRGQCRFFACDLLPRWERVIGELGGARAHVFEIDGGDPVWLMLRLYREFLAHADAGETTVEALVYDLCVQIAAVTEDDLREPSWLADVDAMVHEHFRDPLDLVAVASQVGVHAAHLCRTFRRFRGRTISDAILRMRVQFVCRRLIESDESLATIAAESGFTDQSHMSHIFKRLTGYAPGVHRRRERTAGLQT